jgi:hypothetical protein
MSSPVLHKTIFFSESFLGDRRYKIQFKKFLDFYMTIFGFCQHLVTFKKNVGMTTLPTRRAMSSLPNIHA